MRGRERAASVVNRAVPDLWAPQVMGVLNVTPDSFSDGGRYSDVAAALSHARRMVAEGASIIDVGGESTRPGAAPITVDQELERVIPVISALARELPVLISIDTSKPEVMEAAVAAGAGMINDVMALRAEGAMDVARRAGVPVCLMHMRGKPRTMQHAPSYNDVVAEVRAFLAERVASCVEAGIPRDKLVIDPGFGFGKTPKHNLALLRRLDALRPIGAPIVVGLSRKSMIGAILDVGVQERLWGTVALTAIAVWQGATIVRVHDVRENFHALRIAVAGREDIS